MSSQAPPKYSCHHHQNHPRRASHHPHMHDYYLVHPHDLSNGFVERLAWDIQLPMPRFPILKTFKCGILRLGCQNASLSVHLSCERSSGLRREGGRLYSLQTYAFPCGAHTREHSHHGISPKSALSHLLCLPNMSVSVIDIHDGLYSNHILYLST